MDDTNKDKPPLMRVGLGPDDIIVNFPRETPFCDMPMLDMPGVPQDFDIFRAFSDQSGRENWVREVMNFVPLADGRPETFCLYYVSDDVLADFLVFIRIAGIVLPDKKVMAPYVLDGSDVPENAFTGWTAAFRATEKGRAFVAGVKFICATVYAEDSPEAIEFMGRHRRN